MRPMLRRMLAERFNLAVRHERRTLPVFELMPAAGGVKFVATKEGGCITRGSDAPLPALAPPPAPMPNICGWGRRIVVSQTPTRVEQIEGIGVPISNLIRRLEPEVGRIIIDRTGFTENFSYRVAFVPNDVLPELAGPASQQETTGFPRVESSAVSIGTALTEQLGLELRSTQGEVEVLIIERIDRPTPN
jgi:uncharacterized protein (TIGR03435 family)